MSAQKLRADPDDQPPIEERSIMMPNFVRIRPLYFWEPAGEKKPLMNHSRFFLPAAPLPLMHAL
jgi:hypothetical protein